MAGARCGAMASTTMRTTTPPCTRCSASPAAMRGVQFGGDHGKALDISAGDVAILPAGTGHQLHIGQRRFLRGRRLSAGTGDADHAADAGEPREGAEDDPGSEAAEDRSGAGSARSVDAVVETRLTLRSIILVQLFF